MKHRVNRSDLIITGSAVVLCVVSLLILTAPFIRPNNYYPLQLLPLVSVYLLIPATIFFILALTKGRKIASLFSIGSLILLSWHQLNNFQIHPISNKASGEIKVLSYNVEQFQDNEQKVDQIIQLLRDTDADIICLQEFGFQPLWPNADSILTRFRQSLNLQYSHFFRHQHNIFGLAILSKYPIVEADTLIMPISIMNGIAKVAIETPNKRTFSLIIYHNYSFNFGDQMNETSSKWDQLFDLNHIIPATYSEQLNYVNLMQSQVIEEDRPAILAGDLNAHPGTYIYRMMAAEFLDSFLEAGNGLGYTFNSRGIPMRIDYQFASKHWKVVDHLVIKSELADHYPILVSYALKDDN